MAKIAGFVQKVFGKNATNIGQVGSAAAGTKVITSDTATIQALSAFENGISDVTVTAKRLIPQEEFMALHYLHTLQNAYAQQEGIQEYNSGVTYFTNSIVKKSGTYELYGSLVDDNIGNALGSGADTANWKYLGKLSSLLSPSDSATYFTVPNSSYPTKPWIVQFVAGTYVTAQGTQTLSFPITFPHSCLWVAPFVQVSATTGESDCVAQYVSSTTSNCTILMQRVQDTWTTSAKPTVIAFGN